MSDPMETSENQRSLAHSEGETQQRTGQNGTGHGGAGSDVGGPAAATESTAEESVTGTSTVGAEDDPDDQATNPL